MLPWGIAVYIDEYEVFFTVSYNEHILKQNKNTHKKKQKITTFIASHPRSHRLQFHHNYCEPP